VSARGLAGFGGSTAVVSDDVVVSYLAIGALGAGFVEDSLRRGLEAGADFIGADAGSSDPGPRYLAGELGVFSDAAYRRDLRLLVKAAKAHGIPLVVGSCGTSGNNWGVDYFASIVREIADDEGLNLSVALVYAEMDRPTAVALWRADRFRELDHAPRCDEASLERARRIVAVMGVEPIQEAISRGADVVLAGRATDTAVFAAVPLRRGADPALAWHAGKIAECGTSAAEPRGRLDVLRVEIRHTDFVVTPLRDDIRCTPLSVSGVQLHEVANPFEMVEPGWIIDLTGVSYEAVSDRAVRVSGATAEQMPYTNKLEAVEFAGHQSMFMCAIRDPTILEALDAWMAGVQGDVERRCEELVGPEALGACEVHVRIFGRDGVMGDREPNRVFEGHEALVVVDVVSSDPALTATVIDVLDYAYLHAKSPSWRGHGTLAYPFANKTFDLGECYRFSLNHVVAVADPLELFRIVMEDVHGA
jgi:hypothetical protein